MTAIEAVTQQALALPAEDRAELAERLVLSLDPTEDHVWNTWLPEFARRIEEVRAGKVKTIPAEQVFADGRALLKRAD
jgi:putative addiction module component (TIGR02574 family)